MFINSIFQSFCQEQPGSSLQKSENINPIHLRVNVCYTLPCLTPREAMEIWVFPWESQRGKGTERKIFSNGSFTLLSLTISVVYSEAQCLDSWWARVRLWAGGKGAGNGMRSRKTLLFPSVWSEAKKPTWVEQTVMWLICKEKKGQGR